ncbi:MAG: hypothetical protein DMF95_18495 [Acidobacteria bacterium]|nr:MAG: hypothetical protein DMF96_00410 [Acidobacteriota bacterium]PYR16577.1 MAG: hypothetical protein DMF94_27455 [Acidobacteriota bacterium]PYR46462.1 MAG: hypothetical protein DMF95_18495 [Acidobacteriota bacterium]
MGCVPAGPVARSAAQRTIRQEELIDPTEHLAGIIHARNTVVLEQPAQLEQVVHPTQVVGFAVGFWREWDVARLTKEWDSGVCELEGVPQFVHQRGALHEGGSDGLPCGISKPTERQHQVGAREVGDARVRPRDVEVRVVLLTGEIIARATVRVQT